MKNSLLKSQFFGTKEELVAEIAIYEANHPDLYLLRRKKTGAPLPVTPRRIQQYCDEGIMGALYPSTEKGAKGAISTPGTLSPILQQYVSKIRTTGQQPGWPSCGQIRPRSRNYRTW